MYKLFNSIEESLHSVFGENTSIVSSSYVGGGDINDAKLISLSNGERVFLKSNRGKAVDLFIAEAEGLAAIERTGAISVPKVLALGKDNMHGSFLIMEYIESAPKIGSFWTEFADDLAAMHKSDTTEPGFVPGGRYGFYKDNIIGSSDQKNTPYDSWIEFFREQRLMPLLEYTSRYYDNSMLKRINTFLDNLDRWLVEPKQPSLLHGDLWGGNFIVGNDGKAWLIDPAVYVGHAEADIAMTELFGGFSGEFYREYTISGLLMDGYQDRRDIYNLYHLLNHLKLFGGSYYGSVERIIKNYT